MQYQYSVIKVFSEEQVSLCGNAVQTEIFRGRV